MTASPQDGAALRIVSLEHGRGLTLAGTLDLSTESEARQAVEPIARPGARVTLDLSELEFMDSTGLNLIVGALGKIGEEGHLTLRLSEGITERVVGVSGLADRPNVTIHLA